MRPWVALVFTLAVVFVGCGAENQSPPILGPTPLTETTEEVDQVLVTFRVERVEEFQSTEFRFDGSVKNVGPPRAGARFEVVSTRNIPDPNGNFAEQVIATQSYDTLQTNQVQPIAVTGVVPNVSNVTITGRFAHQ